MSYNGTQVRVFSPDGKKSDWYYMDQIPEGWLRNDPKSEETAGPTPTPETASTPAPKVPGHTSGLTDTDSTQEPEPEAAST